jgi:ABC-type protease/lipase transport system fused ATPase/permease subunit
VESAWLLVLTAIIAAAALAPLGDKILGRVKGWVEKRRAYKKSIEDRLAAIEQEHEKLNPDSEGKND